MLKAGSLAHGEGSILNLVGGSVNVSKTDFRCVKLTSRSVASLLKICYPGALMSNGARGRRFMINKRELRENLRKPWKEVAITNNSVYLF